MGKFLTLVIAGLIAAATPAQANTLVDVSTLQASLMVEAKTLGLDWKVGDEADYKLTIGTFIKGKSHNFVREDVGTSLWMVQDMDLGAMGKQKMEILINKTTGAIEKLLVNGQEQQVPDAGEIEIIETKEARITVPAGAFDCIYVKIRSSEGIQEAWLNPQAVPMGGNLKVMADSQLGKVTQELVAAKKAE
ncbi:MAG: hypothetical protein V4692_16470 [Bdellovibrionota bacterium]